MLEISVGMETIAIMGVVAQGVAAVRELDIGVKHHVLCTCHNSFSFDN